MSDAKISDAVRARVREQAGDRCGYCLAPQRLVLGRLEIEHIVPRSRGGPDREENLWLACQLCNNGKSDHVTGVDPITGQIVLLFDPRAQRWADHFAWGEDGAEMTGTTPCGRATVLTLQLNNPIAVMVRREWASVGWHPPAAS